MALEIIWTNAFKNKYKKWQIKYPQFQDHFRESLNIFVNNPFEPILKTHKLSGKLKDLWAFSISYDQRFIFEFVDNNTIIAKDIGTHKEVY